MDIMFILDKCHCSPAVMTPDKYEHDSKDQTYIFTESIFGNREIKEWSFSNPDIGINERSSYLLHNDMLPVWSQIISWPNADLL